MFTYHEKTVKNKTVADAIAAAKSVLKERGIPVYCCNATNCRDPQEKITMEEMSNLVEKIVDDTHFYND